MPDGGSYYLVSQCSSAEEFVASFRRYAENESLFVPTGEPLGVGLRTHIAVTLSDGSVMIDGRAEITSASVRGAGLHGRAGMTVRFLDLDADGRELLIQLARSRALSRPVPLPSHLRPRPLPAWVPSTRIAEVRARPRRSASTGPALDAAAAMAECAVLAVDAPERTEDSTSSRMPTRTEDSTSGRLPRRTEDSTTGRLPARTEDSASSRLPRRTEVSSSGPLPTAPVASKSGPVRTEVSSSGPLPIAPGSKSGPVRTEVSASGPLPIAPGSKSGPVRTEVSASGPLPTKPVASKSGPVRTEVSASGPLPTKPVASKSGPVRTEVSTSGPLPIAPVASKSGPVLASAPARPSAEQGTTKAAVVPPPAINRARTPDAGWDDVPASGAPSPRLPGVAATAAPRRTAPTTSPPPSPPVSAGPPSRARPTAPPPRPTGTPPEPTAIAASATAVTAAAADDNSPTTAPAEAADDGERSTRPSVPSLQASIGSSVAAAAPEELASLTRAPDAPAPEPRPALPRSGSSTSPPASGKRPASEIITRRRGRIGKDTAEDNMIATWLTDGEEAAAAEAAAAERPPSADWWTPVPQPGSGPLRPSAAPGAALPIARPAAGQPRPALPLPAAEAVPDEIAPETTDVVNLRNRGIPPAVRYLAIAAAVLVIGTVVAFAVSGRREPPPVGPAAEAAARVEEPAAAPTLVPPDPEPPAETRARAPGPGAAAIATAPTAPTPPAETPRPAAAAKSAGSGPCRAQFGSLPAGAEVVIGGKVIGTTPIAYAMPCKAVVATFRRDRYEPMQRKVTPTAAGPKVTARLERPSYSVRLVSSPSGAVVTVAGKKVGKTPLVTKIPGYERVNATFAKPGFATASEKLYAKKSGTVVSVALKKPAAKRR